MFRPTPHRTDIRRIKKISGKIESSQILLNYKIWKLVTLPLRAGMKAYFHHRTDAENGRRRRGEGVEHAQMHLN
jgi:hypothetical protein